MNILIVGNGFDLSHYLPTKYDHFMDVMTAIEASESESMSFDELFSKCREDWFIAKTKQYYLTENIVLDKEQLSKIRNSLTENSWYQYFKNHVREIKTWIDFEQKIEEVLKVISTFVSRIETIISERGLSSEEIGFGEDVSLGQIFLTREYCNILELLKIIKSGYYAQQEFEDDELGIYYQVVEVEYDTEEDQDFKFHIENNYVFYQNRTYKVKTDKIISNLHQKLEDFIEIFNLYLSLVVDQLKPKYEYKVLNENWEIPNHIFSFNYTNTFRKFYKNEIKVEYLHGKCGGKQNIVLGISDIKGEGLINLKAYGFTKYHQKLFKDTDYLFLDEGSPIMERIKSSRNLARWEDTNILIWGHSLDSSDREYITSIFGLNDKKDLGVRVVIFFFNSQAKFALLNNLLAILGKDKVEQWMKKGWLKFEPNPKIDFGVQEESEPKLEAS